MVQLFVMVFPVLDMLSVFPLIAITLGNNFLASLPRSLHHRFKEKHLDIACHLVAAVPPVIMAGLVGSLEAIFSFTGIFAFLLTLVYPCVLELLSQRYVTTRWGFGAERTPYTYLFMNWWFVCATLVVSVFAFGLMLYDLAVTHFYD